METRKRFTRIITGFIKKQAAKVTESDIGKAVRESDYIRNKFEHVGPLGRYLEDVKLFISIVRDYWAGEYRSVPWWAISAIVFTLLYVVSPIDLIPDFIPVIGYVDDAAVISVCAKLVEQELHTYKAWKIRQSEKAQTTENLS